MDNYFVKLNQINVNEHTEEKNGLTYLSWAWAWTKVKEIYPDATYMIYENKDGLFYHTDGKTCWVKTGVTINGIEYIEYLPVMDYRNKSIPVDNVTSFDVNKTIQRSLTKAVARHGLGLYIYAGEDLPDGEKGNNKAEKSDKKSAPKKQTEAETNPQILKLKKVITRYSELTGLSIDEVKFAVKSDTKIDPDHMKSDHDCGTVIVYLTNMAKSFKAQAEKQ